MSTDQMPKEVYEALRNLELEGEDAQISPAMIEILQNQGYVEMVDGAPVVTEAGMVVLNDREEEFASLGGRAD